MNIVRNTTFETHVPLVSRQSDMSIISLRENKLVKQISNVIQILNQDFSSIPAGRAEILQLRARGIL